MPRLVVFRMLGWENDDRAHVVIVIPPSEVLLAATSWVRVITGGFTNIIADQATIYSGAVGGDIPRATWNIQTRGCS